MTLSDHPKVISSREGGVQGVQGDWDNRNQADQQGFWHSQCFKCILVEQKDARCDVKTPSYFSSSVLGQNALKMVEGAVKRKEAAHSSGQHKEKKKKSALDEIMEVVTMQMCFCVPLCL